MDRTDSRFAHSPEPASDDVASPFNPAAAAAAADQASSGDLLPWEGDPPEESGRQRHDAFTGAKKQLYLKALAKHGCILDACRITGVSSSTVYNHQASDPDFAHNCGLAIGMASTPIELTAYERAVVGTEEPVIRGGKVVGTRIKRSDYMLRVLLQGADPKKYGPRPGFTRKRLLKAERKRIEQEVRAEMAEPTASFEEAIVMLDKRLDALGLRDDAKRLEEGWTDLGRGVWIPPGWVWTGEGDPSEAILGLEEKDDAVCNSSNSSTSASLASPSPNGEGGGGARHAGGMPKGETGCEDSRQVKPGGGAAAATLADHVPEPPASAPSTPPPPSGGPPPRQEPGRNAMAEPFTGPAHSLDSAATGDDHGRPGYQGPRSPGAADPRGDAAMDLGDGPRPADDAGACRESHGRSPIRAWDIG